MRSGNSSSRRLCRACGSSEGDRVGYIDAYYPAAGFIPATHALKFTRIQDVDARRKAGYGVAYSEAVGPNDRVEPAEGLPGSATRRQAPSCGLP